MGQKVRQIFRELRTRWVYLWKHMKTRRKCQCGMRPAMMLGDVIVEISQEGPYCFWCGGRL